MDVDLRQVRAEEKEILRNLLEKYDYEFSQWDRRDVNALGLYGYPYLDHYWTEKNRWAYFILADGRLAGFVMVNDYPEAFDRETDFQLAEFFVLYKYRRCGVGKKAFTQVLGLHRGRWQLKLHPKNQVSVRFWDSVIRACTGGQFELVRGYPRTEYEDGTPGDVYFFGS